MNPPLLTGLAGMWLLLLLLAALALLFFPAVPGQAASGAPSRAKSLRTLLAVPAAPTRRPPAGGALSRDVPRTGGLDRSPAAGFSESHVKRWQLKARSSRLVSLEPGCGRLSNRLAIFSDGTRACLRYGINPDQVLGETLSFYLSRLLGIRNVPALALSRVNTNAEQWLGVRRDVQDSQWADRPIVSLTEWISDLSDVVTPPSLRTAARTLSPSLDNVTSRELMELVQWSDLILFDYVTANFDRLASNLLNLQWDSRVMERSTNNLQRTAKGALVFIDNEAGLVHGYRVLPMWDQYHEALLKTICIFRKETARKIAELHKSQDVAQQLLDLYRNRCLHSARWMQYGRLHQFSSFSSHLAKHPFQIFFSL
ncbi:four-jointed box protein 1 [Hemiscyllium ocellatum]|uniref:four-jointed box protein 1 n=1 Tax=Hemiscyllium ocellatum TaxID=170820 RepID=UPI002966E1B5|nr:four-jointed box protein 1 [Hemiscyllium ocellatum]